MITERRYHMKSADDLDKKALIDLLNSCWMTHDGMWFFHCLQECGIEKANRINKEAIRSLAPLETNRIKKTLGFVKEKFESFEELKAFFVNASELFIPDFMNVTMSFPGNNVLHWEFEPNNCFAYKGIKRIGFIDQYECGVIYRLECWFKSLGLKYSVNPEIQKCLMLRDGTCSGDFTFTF